MNCFDQALAKQLQQRHAQHRYRSRLVVDSPQSTTMHVAGKNLLTFCSNDYLGLANHPKIVEAFTRAAHRYGVGSGASHLINGHSLEHHRLEEELAEFTGRDRALLFSTGYMANIGVINALLGRRDAVFEDKSNHASLLDGGLLSSAQFVRYHHNNVNDLKKKLIASSAEKKLIVTDGVFSMDGDFADLPALCALANEYDGWVMVDDAHGIGCIGKNGNGTTEYFNLGQTDIPILMGTLGKAFGCFGAFVAGSTTLIEALIQFARSYIYTTALPPAVAAATRASLQLIKEESWRREKLQALIQQFRNGCEQLNLPLMPSTTAIQPIVIGADQRTKQIADQLQENGILVTAIRPPTVPVGTARLRVTFSAEHTEADVEHLLNALASSFALNPAASQQTQSP